MTRHPSRRGSLSALALVVGLLAGAGPARADGSRPGQPTRIGVYVYAAEGLSEPERRELEVRARDAARAAGGPEVVTLSPAPDRGASPALGAREALAAGDRALAEGQAKLRQLELEPATALLRGASDAYSRHLPQLLDRDRGPHRLVEALVHRTVAAYLLGDEASAEVALRAALVLEPELESVAQVIPPDVEEFVVTRQFLIDELGRGTLTVGMASAGAEVFVSGRPVGTAPLRVDGLVPGPTVVHLVAPDGAGLVARIEVAGRGQETVLDREVPARPSADLPIMERARAELGRGASGKAMRDAAATAGVEALLVLVPVRVGDRPRLRAYLYDMREGRLVREGEGGGEALAAADRLGGELVATARWQPLVEAGPSGPPLWRRVREHRYFWPAVGVAAGLVVVGVAVAAADGGLDNGTKIGILSIIEF